MNYRLVSKLLGFICFLIGLTMLFCLPWAFPAIGRHTDSIVQWDELSFEGRGFLALGLSTCISFSMAGIFFYLGRQAKGQIFLREAISIVGLSWILATFLGSLPFLISKTYRSCSVRVFEDSRTVFVSKFNWNFFDEWYPVDLSSEQRDVLAALTHPPVELSSRKALGLTRPQLEIATGLMDEDLDRVLSSCH